MSLANLLKKGGLRQLATAIPATFATVAPLTPPKVARVATVATVAVANPQTTAANELSSVSSVGVWAVFENTQLASDLIEAAMRRCDEFGDGGQARADMRQQCLELPPRLQADLLEHFQGKRPTLQPGAETKGHL